MAEPIRAASGRIFISYRREESAYPAGWLYDRLADRYGEDQVFKDVDSIDLGDDFVEVITGAVAACDVLLAVIGQEWLTVTDDHGGRRLDNPDDFVRLEIEAALSRKVRVIPILVDEASMPRAEELPDSLAPLERRQALELSPVRFDSDTNRLLKVLDKTLVEVQTEQVDRLNRLNATSPAQSTTRIQERSERRGQSSQSHVGVAPPSPARPLSDQESAPRDQRQRSKRVRVFGVVGVGVVLVLLLVAALTLRPQPMVRIPDPGQRTIADAEALLQRAGLTVGVTREASKAVATGQLIRMSPLAGTTVRRGALVTLFISSGPKVIPLPAGTRELKVGFVDRFDTAKENPNGLLEGFDPILSGDPVTGQPKGLDVDLLNAMGGKLGVQFSYTDLGHFTHSLDDVKHRRVNISISVLRDDAKGREQVDYIDYLDPGIALVIPKDNPYEIRSLKDLCGKRVVRPLETPSDLVEDQSQQCIATGKPAIRLMTCPKQRSFNPDAGKPVHPQECPLGGDPLRLVIDQQVHAAVLDPPVAKRLMKTSTIRQQLAIINMSVKAAPYGIAVAKHDNSIRTALQSALAAIIADGTYDKILTNQGLQGFALKTAGVNGGP
jgi:ABC-type amino acid transport substrate-binding protein